MATAVAIAMEVYENVFVWEEGTWQRKHTEELSERVQMMNAWGKHESSLFFFAERIKCACLEERFCNHGRPPVVVGDTCWRFMHHFEDLLNMTINRDDFIIDNSRKCHCDTPAAGLTIFRGILPGAPSEFFDANGIVLPQKNSDEKVEGPVNFADASKGALY